MGTLHTRGRDIDHLLLIFVALVGVAGLCEAAAFSPLGDLTGRSAMRGAGIYLGGLAVLVLVVDAFGVCARAVRRHRDEAGRGRRRRGGSGYVHAGLMSIPVVLVVFGLVCLVVSGTKPGDEGMGLGFLGLFAIGGALAYGFLLAVAVSLTSAWRHATRRHRR